MARYHWEGIKVCTSTHDRYIYNVDKSCNAFQMHCTPN